jgi:two-component system cell cycle sensor histidine kinase/response regulator CckA
VLLSARAGEEASVEGLASGADDYLTKPFTARELLARVGAHLAMAEARREALAREAEARVEVERAVARLNFALEATRTVAFDWDLVEQMTEYSQSAETVLGIPSGRTRDRADLVHPDDRERVADLLAHAFATQPVADLEFRIVRPDTGEVRWIHMTGVVTRDAEGNPVRATGVGRDVTERRSAELQAQGAQRLDAVGQLAGGVAHEVNNALTGVLGFAQLALRRVSPGEPLRRDLEQIIRSGERAAGVAQQLLAYSRRQILRPRRLDLAQLVRDFEPLLRQTLGPEKELALELPAPAWVNADQAQLEQVLLNLALNARDAMRYEGRAAVGVAVELVAPDTRRPTSSVELPPGAYAVLSVSDTGVGMDRETQARLFEPFFTTKPVGQGTGLGLATVYGIVRQSGGFIWVYSEPGRGTTVRVALPLLAAPGAETGAPATAEAPATGRQERVLVVDDEPVVRGVLEEVLEAAGYTVRGAGSGAEALEVIQGADGRFDLVLTDLVMPSMSGRELAERLAADDPSLPILFMSGFTNDEGIRRGLLSAGAAFIQKPLNLDHVVRTVQRLLNGEPATA